MEERLTINDMDESVGCHAVIVLRIDGERWWADVGMPLYVPLPVDEAGPTHQLVQNTLQMEPPNCKEGKRCPRRE